MDQAQVQVGLLSAWTGPEGELISNDEVLDCVQRHDFEFLILSYLRFPTRFRGLCSVNLRQPMKAIADLKKRAVQGFVGVRVLPWLWELPPNHRLFTALLPTMSDLHLPLCIQVGHSGPMKPSEYGRPIPYVDDIAREFPDLTIVGGHIGYPWTNEMIALCTKHRNVYIDTSAYTAKRYPQELVTFINTNGKSRVLFGSNYPMLTPERCLMGLESLLPDPATREKFLSGNARKVFKLGKSLGASTSKL